MSVDETKYVRDIVVEGIADRIRLITIANGYDYEIADKVFCLVGMPSNSPLPCAMLYETKETIRNRTGGLYSCDMTMSILAAAPYSGIDPDSEGRKLIGNIQRAIVKPQLELYFQALKLNSLTEQTQPAQIKESANFMNTELVENQVVIQVDFSVLYDRAIDDPRRIL